jgi:hypothetical protein
MLSVPQESQPPPLGERQESFPANGTLINFMDPYSTAQPSIKIVKKIRKRVKVGARPIAEASDIGLIPDYQY